MVGVLGEKISDAAGTVSETLTNARDHLRQSAHQVAGKAEYLTDIGSQKMDDIKYRAGNRASTASEKIKSSSDEARDGLLRQSRNLQGSLQYMLQEQPLALAAIGIALGAAIGAALPSTERENQLLGKRVTKWRLKQRQA